MSDVIAENKVTVKIFGEEYPITGSSDPAHIARVAEFVDTMMREVARVSRSKARDKVAILTALTLASELLEMRDQLKHLEDDQSSYVDTLMNRLDIALDSREQVKR
jgi:cell division protein ZapA